MHDLGGKKMTEMRSEMGWLTEASQKYAASLKSYGDSLKALMGIQMPTPLGFPELPNRPFGSASELGREAASALGIETEAQRSKRIADLQKHADTLRELNRRGDPNVSGNMVIEAEQKLKKAIDDTGNAASKAGKTQSKAYQQVSTVVTDLSRGITDLIFKGGKLGDMLTNVAKQAAQSITRLLIEGALKKLTDKLLDVGGLMGKVFGGGTGVVKSVTDGMGDLGGAAGKVSGGIGGAANGATKAASGMMGAVSMVADVATAISSVIGNLQMMGMNKSLDIIVKHTLQTANDLANLRADEWLREGHLFAKLDDMWRTNIGIYDLLGRGAVAGGGASVVINLNGGDPKAALEEITRTLKQYGVIPRG